jgi:hypothetical protein
MHKNNFFKWHLESGFSVKVLVIKTDWPLDAPLWHLFHILIWHPLTVRFQVSNSRCSLNLFHLFGKCDCLIRFWGVQRAALVVLPVPGSGSSGIDNSYVLLSQFCQTSPHTGCVRLIQKNNIFFYKIFFIHFSLKNRSKDCLNNKMHLFW